MAHIWFSDHDGYAVVALEHDRYGLCPNAADGIPVRKAVNAAGDAAASQRGVGDICLVRAAAGEASAETWAILSARPGGSTTHVNGVPVTPGLRVLHDRDEIRIGARRLYFSAERRARVEPIPQGQTPLCPRCQSEIECGSPGVQCPALACGVWYHERDDKRCWTSEIRCTLCDQSTDPDAGFGWTPEEI